MLAVNLLSVLLVIVSVNGIPPRLYSTPEENSVNADLHQSDEHSTLFGTNSKNGNQGLSSSLDSSLHHFDEAEPNVDVDGMSRVADSLNSPHMNGENSVRKVNIDNGRSAIKSSSPVGIKTDNSKILGSLENLVDRNNQRVTDRISLERSEDINALNHAAGFVPKDLTVTVELTEDVYTTSTNVFYNTIPVTLTQFIKTTRITPTVKIDATPVDDRVMISTVPVTRVDTVTVTNKNTLFHFVTEISTDIYTITHRAYDIQQQVVTSTLVETQVLRPTIVSTVILSEYETSTETQTITNTMFVDPRPANAFSFASNAGGSHPVLQNSFSSLSGSAQNSLSLEQMRQNLMDIQQGLINVASNNPNASHVLVTLLVDLQLLKESVNTRYEDVLPLLENVRVRQHELIAALSNQNLDSSLGASNNIFSQGNSHKNDDYHHY